MLKVENRLLSSWKIWVARHPVKNTKLKRQPTRHLRRYVEGCYAEPRDQLEYLPQLIAVLDKERVKVARELTEAEEEVDSNDSLSATTNEGRDSNLKRILLQDANADNSLNKYLLQEINNSYEQLDENLLQDTDSSYEQNQLQDTDVDKFFKQQFITKNK